MKYTSVTKDNPKISVVMATYNGEAFIAEAIASVLKQSFKDFEFIIVDDGSTDSTSKIIKNFKDLRIHYIKKDVNTGIADSLNLGIKNARGKYIARMDDDDICDPTRFKIQYEYLEQNSNIIVCASNHVRVGENADFYKSISHETLKLRMLFQNCIVHPTVMMRKSSLPEDPYRTEKVPSEDYDLWTRLIPRGLFHQLKEPLLIYRNHVSSQTTKRRQEQLALNVEIIINLYNHLGIVISDFDKENIKIYASHDYSITPDRVLKLMNWFNSIKKLNLKKQWFNTKTFDNEVKSQSKSYLIKYFLNNSKKKKVITFIKLPTNNKSVVLKYYLGI